MSLDQVLDASLNPLQAVAAAAAPGEAPEVAVEAAEAPCGIGWGNGFGGFGDDVAGVRGVFDIGLALDVVGAFIELTING